MEKENKLPIDFELGYWIEQMEDCAKKIDDLNRRQASDNWNAGSKDQDVAKTSEIVSKVQ